MSYKHCFVLAVGLLLSSCQSRQMSPLDNEAFDQGSNYKKEHMSFCGDHYFAYYTPASSTSSSLRILLECTQVITVGFSPEKERELTEADKLNGLEWRGKCSFMCKSYRVNRDGKWSEWKDGIIFNIEYPGLDGMSLMKIKGQWKFGDDRSAKLESIPCDKVPKE